MTNDLKEVENLAKQVRCYLEVLVLNNKDSKTLCGFCGVGSAFLKRIGLILGFDFDFICGMYESRKHSSGHCWVEYKNLIIDITGTQFYKDIESPIYIIKKNKRYKSRFKNDEAMKQMRLYWPKEQQFDTYESQLENIAIVVGKKIILKNKKETQQKARTL